MKKILIRTDASILIGSGHVIRCRTLARELSKHGVEVIFVCRRQPGDLIDLLKQEFKVIILTNLPTQIEGRKEKIEKKEEINSSQWLGCGQEQDARDCLQEVRMTEPGEFDWVIVDHYSLDIDWEKKIIEGLSKSRKTKLLVIDDLANRKHQADILIDQNYFGARTEKRYERWLPENCRQLLGPKYALLGPEYALLHPLTEKRTEIKRVLIYFGGVDSENITARALQALMDPELSDLAVDVVLGVQAPYRQEIEEIVAIRKLTTLHNPLPSLASLIARADVCIGAGGATTWERICLKLHTLVVTVAENQEECAHELHKSSAIKLLGKASTATVNNIKRGLTTIQTSQISMSENKVEIDALGTLRVYSILNSHNA